MRALVFAVSAAFLISGCAPSLQYRIGQGFYSDQFSKPQVQAQADKGQVENLGRFSVVKGGCFNYTQDATDESVVFPAIRDALEQKGGNVADQVTANEQWYDFVLGLFIIPGLVACSNWTVSGDVMKVAPLARPPTAASNTAPASTATSVEPASK